VIASHALEEQVYAHGFRTRLGRTVFEELVLILQDLELETPTGTSVALPSRAELARREH